MEGGTFHVLLFASGLAWHMESPHLADSWAWSPGEGFVQDQPGQSDGPGCRGAPGLSLQAQRPPWPLLLFSSLCGPERGSQAWVGLQTEEVTPCLFEASEILCEVGIILWDPG